MERFATEGRLAMVVFVVVAIMAFACPVTGQPLEPLNSDQGAELPNPLTPEAIRALVAELDEADVRKLLLEELDARAERDETSNQSGLIGLVGNVSAYRDAIRQNTEQLFRGVLLIPSALKVSFANFTEGRGLIGFFIFLALVALCLLCGIAVELALRFVLRRPLLRVADATPASLVDRMRILSLRVGLQLLGVAVFYAAARVTVSQVFPPESHDQLTAINITFGVLAVRVVIVLSRFLLAPRRPELRLCHTDDGTARYLTRQYALISCIFVGNRILHFWMWGLGVTPGSVRLGFWINAFGFAMVIWTIWHARDGLSMMFASADDGDVESHQRDPSKWPMSAMGLVFFEWLIVEAIVATGNIGALSSTAIFTTLFVILFFPSIDTLLRTLVQERFPYDPEDQPADHDAQLETQRSVLRAGRVFIAGASIFLLTGLWGVNLLNLAEQGFGARFAGILVQILLVATVAYTVWECLAIYINRRIAQERRKSAEEGDGDAEIGGKGGTRVETLLPLLQRIAQAGILIITGLVVVGEVGVSVAPLLAGIGILGLAIGFGAQTLVRDIVSGIFFLIDDAFRIGEYVDVGGTMGAIERISVRSLRLRHHRGPVHTVPYGEIAKLTNYSRDWVIMKLKFRVPFDTDVEQVRKIFKQIGRDLLQDSVLGDDFLQPFKSQGVFEVDDSGMVIRGKFMAKPGKQFMIRKEVYVRVQQAFDEAGIPFARKQVIVQVPGMETAKTENVVAPMAFAALAAGGGMDAEDPNAENEPSDNHEPA